MDQMQSSNLIAVELSLIKQQNHVIICNEYLKAKSHYNNLGIRGEGVSPK